VYPGGTVPIDGLVILGKGICNEAMLTGESRPIAKEVAAKVYGGSILLQGNLIVKVTKTAENSSINQIIKLVEGA
jgi:P-type E1-E2 ATPase